MEIHRREFLLAAGALVLGAGGSTGAPRAAAMYGTIGKMNAKPGQRDALIGILLAGIRDMPGCLSYVVAKDAADENAIWITEVWDRKESHDASLTLPTVRDAIARGRPLIAGFGDGVVTTPVGGHGLPG